MIVIPIEQPPSSLPPEVQEYLNRVIIGIAGALAEADKRIETLEERVAVLEKP